MQAQEKKARRNELLMQSEKRETEKLKSGALSIEVILRAKSIFNVNHRAANMRNELTRLRGINMQYEEDIARLRSENVKFNERIRSFGVEMESKDHELMNLSDLCGRRKQELLNIQSENDKLMNMLRNATGLKDDIDAQKMVAEERYIVI